MTRFESLTERMTGCVAEALARSGDYRLFVFYMSAALGFFLRRERMSVRDAGEEV